MRRDFPRLLVLLVLVVAAACGGDDEGAAIDAGGGEPADAAPGSEADAGASDASAAEPCGGLQGLQCDEAHYCDWPEDTCGRGDETGSCLPRPTECDRPGPPVCGCDVRPYESACAAAMAGFDVAQVSICMTADRL